MPNKQDRFTEEQQESILALIPLLDGHTIFSTDILKDFPANLSMRFTREHVSNRSVPKGTLFDRDGVVLTKLQGVYGLQVLECICDDLGIAYQRSLGRGSQARACQEAIRQHFEQ